MFGCGDRNESRVVRTGSAGTADRVENADHFEALSVAHHGLSHDFFRRLAEVLWNVVAQNDHPAQGRVFLKTEKPAVRDRVVEDLRVVVGRADQPGVGVVPRIFELTPGLQLRHNRIDIPRVLLERFDIVNGQGHLFPGHAHGEELRGRQRQDVGTQRRELIVDALLRARPGCQHRDDRAHADDDAQCREHRTKQIGPDRLKRDANDFSDQHGPCSLQDSARLRSLA